MDAFYFGSFFVRIVSEKPNTPKKSSIAYDTLYTG